MPHVDVPRFARLSDQDTPRLAALEQCCFSLPWHEEQYRAAFTRRFFHAYGFKLGDELLAYVSLYAVAGSMEILNVATHPGYRRRGLSRALLFRVLRLARRMGMEDAVLEVRHLNVPAITLYEGLGFARAGVRKAYYPDTGEDGVIYTLDITAYCQ